MAFEWPIEAIILNKGDGGGCSLCALHVMGFSVRQGNCKSI